MASLRLVGVAAACLVTTAPAAALAQYWNADANGFVTFADSALPALETVALEVRVEAMRRAALPDPAPAQEMSLVRTVPARIATSDEARVRQYDTFVEEASRTHHVSAALIRAVIHHESRGFACATSHAGAQGLMQLMPGTATTMGVRNRCDPRENILGGTRYLRQLLDEFRGDIPLVLAAYDAGPGAVRRFGGRIPPYTETQRAVPATLALYRHYLTLGPSAPDPIANNSPADRNL